MKAILRTVCSIFLSLIVTQSYAQCTQAKLNWDNLDYYYTTVGLKPYGGYISVAMAQNQKFAIGTTYVNISTPGVAYFITGENATHTGNLTIGGVAYTGEDAQFTPSSNGQSITISFGAPVQDVYFTLYDLDADAQYTITARDEFTFPKTINATFQSPTMLTTLNSSFVPTNNTSNLILSSINGNNVSESANDGTATIFIAGSVKDITINIPFIGTDAKFWLSDITACVSGSFPTNYHQVANSRPYTGQPSYFLGTPDNQYAFMIGLDPTQTTASANYRVTSLFGDSTRFINSMAYDPINRFLYYVIDGTGTANMVNNKQLKRYNFNTETSSMVVGDLTTLGIPTFEQGVESAGASFYNGALYLGIEGGRHNDGSSSSPAYSTTRETIIYKIEFDASFNAVNAYQVWAKEAYDPTGNTNQHDWGDILVKDGVLYNFNTSQTASMATVHRVDLMTGQMTNSPTSTNIGQVSLDWSGNMYSVKTQVYPYNATTGLLGTGRGFVVSSGSQIFPIGAGVGDASEPFRPKVDLGDAPDSYDPDPLAPALHDYTADTRVRLGATLDREWLKSGSAEANLDGADEDGVPIVYMYDNGLNYSISVNVFNNQVVNNSTTNVATLCAWLDYNMNGTFEATEGISRTISKSTSMQTISLTWPTLTVMLPNHTQTYLRIRIASNNPDATKNLTTSKPTGYMPNGEVEDYYVMTSTWLLPLNSMEFNVQKEGKNVQLQWSFDEDSKIRKYVVTRSADAVNFEPISEIKSNKGRKYLFIDKAPLNGKSYYRLQVIDQEGKSLNGDIRSVVFEQSQLDLSVHPNPVVGSANLRVSSALDGNGTITLFNATGLPVHTEIARLQKGQNYVNLRLQQVPEGTYIVQVQVGQFTERKKLILKK